MHIESLEVGMMICDSKKNYNLRKNEDWACRNRYTVMLARRPLVRRPGIAPSPPGDSRVFLMASRSLPSLLSILRTCRLSMGTSLRIRQHMPSTHSLWSILPEESASRRLKKSRSLWDFRTSSTSAGRACVVLVRSSSWRSIAPSPETSKSMKTLFSTGTSSLRRLRRRQRSSSPSWAETRMAWSTITAVIKFMRDMGMTKSMGKK
mmetsp:Transcript_47809/g.123999  ORF Transcript_47809/g.123999 Transcript_47809/m.123999 type:complete len:206 (+) Transcript_47809:211-828(+)